MTVRNRTEAWEVADKIFPTDYELDSVRSKNAGYDIWFSTTQNAWISDLGCRLEVNLPDKTINIWIEDNTMNFNKMSKLQKQFGY